MQTTPAKHGPTATDTLAERISRLPEARVLEVARLVDLLEKELALASTALDDEDADFADEGITPAELARRDTLDAATLQAARESVAAGEPVYALEDVMKELGIAA